MKLLFSDIDGTITNKFSHAFEGSEIYLDKLIKGGFTVVLTSSKTFEEITFIQKQLEFSEMFIFENGSGIAFPIEKYAFLDGIKSSFREQQFLIYPLAPMNLPIQNWRQIMKSFFNNAPLLSGSNVEELMTITGLTKAALKRAQNRKFTETCLIEYNNSTNLQIINNQLLNFQGVAEIGSRFLTVSHHGISKGIAIKKVIELLSENNRQLNTFSIGDGLNDFTMFNETDYCFFLSEAVNLPDKIKHCSLINQAGPSGFAKAVELLLLQ